jgi:outer membrane lipoprotein SlyB
MLNGLAPRAGAVDAIACKLKTHYRKEKEMKYSRLALIASLSLLGACSVMPAGPSVMALPGTGKTFDQFRVDDNSCRQFAFQQVGGVSTNQAATNTAVGSAVVGTALGAAAGAAFNGGSGAAVGAGAGLLAGTLFGAGASQNSAYDVQRRYDYAYLQCMYANGDRIPVQGRMRTMESNGGGGYVTTTPPPPPGSPPPPPPGAY